MSIILVAHRCGTDQYPELTLDAARHSLEVGADYVEMDIRFTKDGVPVISHDKDGVKLFGTTKNVCDLTLKEFQKLRFLANPKCHPHTLEEVLASGVGPILFHIKEGKEQLEIILQYIRKYHYEDKAIMGVMEVEDIGRVKDFHPGMKVLAFNQEQNMTDDFLEAGADIIRLWEEWVTEEKVKFVQSRGRKIWVMAGSSQKHTTGYTSAEELGKWKAMGVNGIIINEIEKTKQILQEV